MRPLKKRYQDGGGVPSDPPKGWQYEEGDDRSFLQRFTYDGKDVGYLEEELSKYLGGVMGKGYDVEEEFEDRHKGDESMLKYDDMIRHSFSSAEMVDHLQSEAEKRGVPKLLSTIPSFILGQALGAGHELTQPSKSTPEDLINNWVGGIIGAFTDDDEKQKEVLEYLAKKKLVPDGRVFAEDQYSPKPYQDRQVRRNDDVILPITEKKKDYYD